MRALAVAALGDLPILVSASDDRTVRVWNRSTGEAAGPPRQGFMSGPLLSLDTATYDGAEVVLAGSREGRVLG